MGIVPRRGAGPLAPPADIQSKLLPPRREAFPSRTWTPMSASALMGYLYRTFFSRFPVAALQLTPQLLEDSL
jgi:hypothetical protein